MRRFYSHYTFIYPTTYLKNHIIVLDSSNRIVSVFPFEKEIMHTEFHSGWLFFVSNAIPQIQILDLLLSIDRNMDERIFTTIYHKTEESYQIFDDNLQQLL